MTTVLDVFDNFLGEDDCRRAANLPPSRWDELSEELRRYYGAWIPPEPIPDRVFPGSWVGHHFDQPFGRTVLGNDLLLFGEVVVHDPIEPFVSAHAAWQPPAGAPTLAAGELPLALTFVPSQRSGQKPVMTTALYPPASKAFMTIPEAYSVNAEAFRVDGIRRALQALETWRPLIGSGSLVLVPVFEVAAGSTAAIARMGQACIGAVSDAISNSESGSRLTSFFTRGVFLTPNWEVPKLAERAKSRHVSWLYAREVAICHAVGALYCPDQADDLEIVAALAAPDVIPVSKNLRRAVAAIDLPGFSDVSLREIAELRRDSNAFHAVRDRLRSIIENAPADLDELLSGKRAQAYLNDHLASEIAAIHREAGELHEGLATHFVQSLLSVGLPQVLSAAAGATAVGGAAGLASQWLARRKFSPSERATLWIERHVGPVGRSEAA